MESSESLAHKVRSALTREPVLSSRERENDVTVRVFGEAIALEGEVDSLRTKRIAFARAAAVPGAGHLVDRLRVRPAAMATDGEILNRVRDALDAEREFDDIELSAEHRRHREEVHDAGPFRLGTIDVRVESGVVTLDGDVPSLSHKRLAGALAWWVAGVRDVVNGLGVEPAQEDDDGELSDALRLVLEADPLVDIARIGGVARNGVVKLTGIARTIEEKEAAEFDAWCLFGVNRVDNLIEVILSTP